ncbi:MAG: thioesterase family protein [Candidatus Eisenbacteria bacterium]
MMHRFDVRVRYGDTDQMGWVYYGNYLRWFEIGRAEMLRSIGRTYRSIEEDDGILLPVLEARCRYLQGARYDELVTIETGVLSMSRATVRFGYRLISENGNPLAMGFTEHCCTDRNARPVRPSLVLRGLLERSPQVPPDLALALEGRRTGS